MGVATVAVTALTVLERKDRDDGTTHLWASLEGERVRFVISTATYNAADGHSVATLMARRAVDDIRIARERGRLKLES